MRRAKIFEQRGCALSRREHYAQRGVCSDRMNFATLIEPMLRGHFI